MIGWTSAAPSMLASFMASLVEFVEALTIVLAVGVVRGWRSALFGAAAGVALLAVLVLTLGNSLSGVPLPILQVAIGVLLLMFGLRWLRKAVLRAGGVLALHDEAESFASESERLRRRGGGAWRTLDKIAFITTFKAVMLEGIEVVFIVIALGAGGSLLVPASVGAAIALMVVLVLGVWLHRPLAKVPENALKFGVGVMLAAFGTFWVGEGIGLQWPGADAAILFLMAVFLLVALGLVEVSRRMNRGAAAERSKAHSGAPVAAAAGVATELWGLFVDDGWLAAGVLIWVFVAWALEARVPIASAGACLVFTSAMPLLLALSVIRRARG
jgi:Ca2+/H+ antiporter, TMEM165/GDT1 family